MKRTIVAIVTSYVLILAGSHSAVIAEQTAPSDFETTVRLYLSADRNYRPGDLIAHSQLDDLQQYLRRTGGEPLATHSRWLKKTLKDHAPLVKLFHSGGRKVLRDAAKKLGGYAELDRLSRSGVGRKMLREAIDAGSSVKLVEFLLAQRAQVEGGIEHSAKPAKSLRLYTVADFVKALALVREAQKESQQVSPETGAVQNR